MNATQQILAIRDRVYNDEAHDYTADELRPLVAAAIESDGPDTWKPGRWGECYELTRALDELASVSSVRLHGTAKTTCGRLYDAWETAERERARAENAAHFAALKEYSETGARGVQGRYT